MLLAKLRVQARLNYRRGSGAGEGAKAEIAKLEEEIAVLAEQEKLLRAEIVPLFDKAQALAQAARAEGEDLVTLRDEIAAGEQVTKRVADEVHALQVEMRAGPRVRLLQEADAVRRRSDVRHGSVVAFRHSSAVKPASSRRTGRS